MSPSEAFAHKLNPRDLLVQLSSSRWFVWLTPWCGLQSPLWGWGPWGPALALDAPPLGVSRRRVSLVACGGSAIASQT